MAEFVINTHSSFLVAPLSHYWLKLLNRLLLFQVRELVSLSLKDILESYFELVIDQQMSVPTSQLWVTFLLVPMDT